MLKEKVLGNSSEALLRFHLPGGESKLETLHPRPWGDQLGLRVSVRRWQRGKPLGFFLFFFLFLTLRFHSEDSGQSHEHA